MYKLFLKIQNNLKYQVKRHWLTTLHKIIFWLQFLIWLLGLQVDLSIFELGLHFWSNQYTCYIFLDLDFANFWYSTSTQLIAYLRPNLNLTFEIRRRLGYGWQFQPSDKWVIFEFSLCMMLLNLIKSIPAPSLFFSFFFIFWAISIL